VRDIGKQYQKEHDDYNTTFIYPIARFAFFKYTKIAVGLKEF